MYVKHFLKMLLGLVLMAVIGIGGLFVANYYSGQSGTVTASGVINSLSGKK